MKIHICKESPCLLQERELLNILNNGFNCFYTKEMNPTTSAQCIRSNVLANDCQCDKCMDENESAGDLERGN